MWSQFWRSTSALTLILSEDAGLWNPRCSSIWAADESCSCQFSSLDSGSRQTVQPCQVVPPRLQSEPECPSSSWGCCRWDWITCCRGLKNTAARWRSEGSRGRCSWSRLPSTWSGSASRVCKREGHTDRWGENNRSSLNYFHCSRCFLLANRFLIWSHCKRCPHWGGQTIITFYYH